MNPITIELPIPAKELSPNSRAHWRVKHKHFQEHKHLALLAAIQHKPDKPYKAAAYRIYFRLKRKQDYDNFHAMCKAYLDGIQAARIVENDSELRPMGMERCVALLGPHFVRITIWPEGDSV